MKKRRVSPIGIAFVALVLLVLLFVVRGALHRPARIVLPQETESGESSDESLDDSSAGRVSVRPDTVQSAIAALLYGRQRRGPQHRLGGRRVDARGYRSGKR